jgi:PAS domain S-box-containing protein
MAAGAFVAAVGALVLLGWALDAALLKSVVPGFPAMKVNAALAFVLIGIGLVLLARAPAPPWTRVLRRGLVTLALVVGFAALVESAVDVTLGVDQLLARDDSDAAGRMGPVTAFGLTTSAAALLLLDLGWAGALAQTLALATGVLGLLNLVGHAYSLHRLLGLGAYSVVAVRNAGLLVVLSVGVLLARPERGFTRMALADSSAGVVVRRLLPVVIAAPLVLGWLVESGRPELAMALSVVGPVVVLSLVGWAAASRLQRTDVQRRRAETALERADAEVGRVLARTVVLTDANKALVDMTARLKTLERLNRLVSSSLDFEAVLVAIARAASDITATPVVSFWVVDEVARTATVRAWSDASVGASFPTAVFAFGDGAVGTVAASRQPLQIPDVFNSAASIKALEWCRAHGLGSFYGAPVLAQDRLLAVLALSRHEPLALGEEDQELLASFVAQAAVAIDNARLFAEAQTRRRAAEAAELRYRELFDRNLAGIIRATRDGRILDCNEALVRIYGYRSREEVLALRAQDLYADPAARARAISPLRAGERITNAEVRSRRADGTQISVLVNVTAVETEGGEVVIEGIIVDITDRERAATAEREAEALRAVAKLANAAAHERDQQPARGDHGAPGSSGPALRRRCRGPAADRPRADGEPPHRRHDHAHGPDHPAGALRAVAESPAQSRSPPLQRHGALVAGCGRTGGRSGT